MLLVDCPLCDRSAPFDTATAELDCPDCHVRLTLAGDATPDLAAAA